MLILRLVALVARVCRSLCGWTCPTPARFRSAAAHARDGGIGERAAGLERDQQQVPGRDVALAVIGDQPDQCRVQRQRSSWSLPTGTCSQNPSTLVRIASAWSRQSSPTRRPVSLSRHRSYESRSKTVLTKEIEVWFGRETEPGSGPSAFTLKPVPVPPERIAARAGRVSGRRVAVSRLRSLPAPRRRPTRWRRVMLRAAHRRPRGRGPRLP
jgi:hypothetical protein